MNFLPESFSQWLAQSSHGIRLMPLLLFVNLFICVLARVGEGEVGRSFSHADA